MIKLFTEISALNWSYVEWSRLLSKEKLYSILKYLLGSTLRLPKIFELLLPNVLFIGKSSFIFSLNTEAKSNLKISLPEEFDIRYSV